MAYNRDLNQDMDDEKMSRINSAGIINITTENLWRDSYSALKRGDLVAWNRALDSLWLILGGDVEEGKADDKKFNEIDLEIHKTGSLSHSPTGFARLGSDVNAIIAKQYLLLRKKALFLRRLQNSQGKGTAYASEEDGDFD